MKRLLLVVALGLLAVLPVHAAVNDASSTVPNVVVTLKPLHSLVSAVMSGVGEPVLLMSGSENPHSFAIRPHDRRHLRDADLVVWTGPELETFIAKTMAGTRSRQIRLLGVEKMDLLPMRATEIWNADHEHKHEYVDPHIWLNPDNARRVVHAVADTLVEMDPANTKSYAANAERILREIMRTERDIVIMLKSVSDRAYIVTHDAYQYFESHFGLKVKGAFRGAAGQQAGARHVSKLQELAKSGQIHCALADARYPDTMVKSLARDTGIKTGSLDPIGVDIPAGPQAWSKMMRRMAVSIRECLTP